MHFKVVTDDWSLCVLYCVLQIFLRLQNLSNYRCSYIKIVYLQNECKHLMAGGQKLLCYASCQLANNY